MICTYTRHIYACGTKILQGRQLMMQQKHHSQRLYGYKYLVNDNMDITSDTTYDAWTYDSITHAYVHNNSVGTRVFHKSPIEFWQ